MTVMNAADNIEVRRLMRAIRDLHRCDCTHTGSAMVRELAGGRVVWDGVLEIFRLSGHPEATAAYAWSHRMNAGGRRYVAVLAVPPVVTPDDAVRAAMAAESRERN